MQSNKEIKNRPSQRFLYCKDDDVVKQKHQTEMKETFMILNGHYREYDLDTSVVWKTVLAMFTLPQCFAYALLAVPMASPYDPEEERLRKIPGMLIAICVLCCSMCATNLSFIECVYLKEVFNISYTVKETLISYVLCAATSLIIAYTIYAWKKYSPWMFLFYFMIPGIWVGMTSLYYIAYRRTQEVLTERNRHVTKVYIIYCIIINNLCVVWFFFYIGLASCYRQVQNYYKDEHGNVSQKGVYVVTAVTVGFQLLKESYLILLWQIYKRFNESGVTVGYLWGLFMHSYFMSIILGGSDTELIQIVFMVAIDFSCMFYSVFKILQCRKKIFREVGNAEIENVPQNKISLSTRLTSLVLSKEQQLINSNIITRDHCEKAAEKMIEMENTFCKYASSVICAEFVEAVVPLIYMCVTVLVYYCPNSELVGGSRFSEWGFNPINLEKSITNLLILFCCEVAGVTVVGFFLYVVFKIDLYHGFARFIQPVFKMFVNFSICPLIIVLCMGLAPFGCDTTTLGRSW